MSADDRKKELERLVGEARAHLEPKGRGRRDDWSAVDGRLLARIREHERAEAAAERRRGVASLEDARAQRPVWLVVGGLAAAAAVALVASHSRGGGDATDLFTSSAGSSSGSSVAQGSAAALTSHEGTAAVRVGGVVADNGREIVNGEAVDTAGGRAVFVSTKPGDPRDVRATWELEARTHVDVKRAASPLVLALGTGAVEAQVTPVPNGEAFAIDVNAVRVAVHGTHLRVARGAGDHVVVDLTEGVVSIGIAPRVGSTTGTLVTAPAHIELDAHPGVSDEELAASVRVDRSPSAIRAAVQLASSLEPAGGVGAGGAGQPTALRPATGASGPLSSLDDHGVDDHGTDERGVEHDRSGDREGAIRGSAGAGAAAGGPSGAGGASASNPAHSVASPATDPHPEATLATAVKSCTLSKLAAGDLRVTVSTKLTLRVGEDGAVTFAQFAPPLAPDAQECASRSIYKTRFAPSGAEGPREIVIPIDVEQAR